MNAYQAIIARNWKSATPYAALFELTYVCNHACSFCYNCPTGQKEMSTQQVFESLCKIADFGVLFITFSGGEPLCRKDFFEIAREAQRLHFAIRIYTNAFLIDDAMAERLKQEVHPFELEISLHGARPETHEALTRVPGSFNKLVAAVRALRKRDMKVLLKTPITRLNMGEVREIKALAASLDADLHFDAVITPKDDGDQEPLEMGADEEFMKRWWSDEFADVREERVPLKRDDSEISAVCGTGRSGFAMDPYGNIYPCVQWRRKVANILEVSSLREIWRGSSVLKEVRRVAEEIPKTTLKESEVGEFTAFCAGVAWLQTGDPTKMYPQAELLARYRKKTYLELQARAAAGEVIEGLGQTFEKCGE
jgi:radical SAM protein with 4Fe4S-binding SPASM domain